MHDGSVTFSTALDNAQLEKDLDGLTKKIEEQERKVADLKSKRDKAREKGFFDAEVLDTEKAKLQEIKGQLAEIRAIAKDKSYSIGRREEAKAQIPVMQEDLRDQQARVNALQAEWNKTENAVGRYTKQLNEAESTLDRQKEEAGKLVQDLENLADHPNKMTRELVKAERELKALESQGKWFGDEEYDRAYQSLSRLTNEVKRYKSELSKTPEQVQREAEKATQQAEKLAAQEKEAERLKEIAKSAEASDREVVNLTHELKELTQRQKDLDAAGVGLGYSEYDKTVKRISEINGKLREYQGTLLETAENIGETAKSAERSATAMDRLVDRVKKLASRVFVFTLITTALRSLRVWMGKVIQTNSEARQSIARLKGALLTLAQPLVEVVIPAFTLLVNVLARVVAAIAQLVSVLFGKTIKQSKNGAEALYKEADAIKGIGTAADEASGSLAGFDEINTISTESPSGSGGGTSAEIVPDFSWMDGMDGVLDRIKEIADLVAIIGAGFALWKISEMLPGVLGVIAQKLAGLPLTIGGVMLYWNGLTDAWENGVDWLNLIEMIGGLAAAAFGLYLLLGPIAAGIALVAGGLGMLVTGFRDAMENGWNLQNTLLSIAGILAAGLGIALVTGSWIPLLIAGIAAVLFALTVATGHGEDLIAGIRLVLEGFADFFGGIFSGDMARAAEGIVKIFEGMKLALWAVVDGIKDALLLFLDWLDEKTNGRFHNIIQGAKEFVTNIFGDIKLILEGFAEFFSGIFTGDLERAAGGIEKIFDGLKSAISTIIIDGIQGILLGFLDWLDEKTNGRFHEIIGAAKLFVSEFSEFAKLTFGNLLDAIQLILTGLIEFLAGVFTGDWELAWTGIKDIFKGAWNHMVSMLEAAVNFIIKGFNWMISQMNKIHFNVPDWVPVIGGKSFGFNIPSLSEVQIPRLAQGAVIPPNREFMAVLGDQRSGNNLEAPEALIRKIVREESGGGNTALLEAILEAIKAGHVIMVDRRVLGQTVTNEQNRMTRQSGRSVVLR